MLELFEDTVNAINLIAAFFNCRFKRTDLMPQIVYYLFKILIRLYFFKH